MECIPEVTGLKFAFLFGESMGMKGLYVCLLIYLFTGCTKENHVAAQQVPAKQATIQYMGNPAADGFGWVLAFSDETFEIPANLPEAFKNIGLKVKVVYKKSSAIFPCRCTEPKYMVDIIAIERIN